jgi:GNAT superfamily N-acetyltransferase
MNESERQAQAPTSPYPPPPTGPRDYAVVEVLRDGQPIHIRAIRPDDKHALGELFERLSPDTIYYRFLGVKKRLTPDELIYLTELDFHRQAALVALFADDERRRIVGVGRYACAHDDPDGWADVAITVEDAEQNRGIGTLLLKHLMLVAVAEGIDHFDACLLSDNERMIRLLEKTGLVTSRSAQSGLCHLVVSTRATPTTFPPPYPWPGSEGGS